ncbi:hypothetical protein BDZ45DRAFT_667895 [Acephala macrosclerotiorum]|nr:hypothetical protein BDZ45DRAFT_667895 [Acephala macrosclerotiorum]
MDDDRARKEAEDRAARSAVTAGLADQKTMNQLSSSGKEAKDKRAEARAKREEAAKAKAQEEAGGKASGSG